MSYYEQLCALNSLHIVQDFLQVLRDILLLCDFYFSTLQRFDFCKFPQKHFLVLVCQ